MKAERPGEERRKLAARHVAVRAEVAAPATRGDSGGRQGLDRAEVDMGSRHVAKCRRPGGGAQLTRPDDVGALEVDVAGGRMSVRHEKPFSVNPERNTTTAYCSPKPLLE